MTGPGALRVETLFPTLVGEAVLPGGAALNAELAALVRARRRHERDRAPLTAVNRGWQSGLDLLDDPHPAIGALRSFLDVQIEAFLRAWGSVAHGGLVPPSFTYRYTGWAVVLESGGFQHEHVHSATTLVGVYYVEVPGPGPAGDLVLVDPRAGRVAARPFWETVLAPIRPAAGKLVLFPSFVPHRVEAVQAPGERISINFDVVVDVADPLEHERRR